MSQDQTQIEETEHHLDLRNLRLDDYNDVKALMDEVYALEAHGLTLTIKPKLLHFPMGKYVLKIKAKWSLSPFQ